MAADKPEPDDLDEDLFDFEPVAPMRAEFEDEDADLDEIFATFQAEEETRAGQPEGLATSATDAFVDLEEDDDIYGDLVETPELAPEPIAEPAPAPAPVAADPTPPPAPAPAPVQAAPAPAPAPAPVAAAAPAPAPAAAPAAEPAVAVPTAGGGLLGRLGALGQSLAARKPAATTAAPAGAPAAGGASLSRSALWILLAAFSLNGLVAIVLVNSTGSMRSQMEGISEDVEQTIRDIRSEYWSQKALMLDETTPLAPADPSNHPAFQRALEEIEAGSYAAARQRLYALLSVVDRIDPAVRERIEARASYLIGRAWHLEALDRLESEEEDAEE